MSVVSHGRLASLSVCAAVIVSIFDGRDSETEGEQNNNDYLSILESELFPSVKKDPPVIISSGEGKL